jgi:hypothetical protein
VIVELIGTAVMTTGPAALAPETGVSEGSPDLYSKWQEDRLKKKKRKKRVGFRAAC